MQIETETLKSLSEQIDKIFNETLAVLQELNEDKQKEGATQFS